MLFRSEGPTVVPTSDVPRAEDYSDGHDVIPGARWRDPAQVDQWRPELAGTGPVLTYCLKGMDIGRSTALALRARGVDAVSDGWHRRLALDRRAARVAGFGHQAVNVLYPASAGASAPRPYHAADLPQFQLYFAMPWPIIPGPMNPTVSLMCCTDWIQVKGPLKAL